MDPNVYEACSDLIRKYNAPVSADEVLASKVNHQVPIPLPSQEELAAITGGEWGENKDLLPHMDMKVLHYFLTQLIVQKYPHLINSFDETALITIGLLLEDWIQEYLQPVGTGATKGPALATSKATNYRESPADI